MIELDLAGHKSSLYITDPLSILPTILQNTTQEIAKLWELMYFTLILSH